MKPLSMPVSRRSMITQSTAGAMALAAPRRARAQTSADVIVIGAGLSGLYAAWLLEAQGFTVTVLEGRRRVGGRVFSVDTVPGHPEGGANAIAGAYARLRDMAQRLDIPLQDNGPRRLANRGRTLILGGKVIAPDAWKDSARNPFPRGAKETMPWAYLPKLIAETNPYTSLDDWHAPDFFAHDISMHDFLTSRGASEAVIELAVNTNFTYGTSAHDVSMMQVYALDFWIKFQQQFKAGNMIAKGGNQRLPEGLARALKSEVRFGRRVVGLRNDAHGVDVVCDDGEIYRGAFAICSAPVSVLRLIKVDPVLTGAQAHAVKTVTYTPCTQVHMIPKSPFWEKDGLPPTMWSDGPAGFVAPFKLGDDLSEITSITAFARDVQAAYLDSLDPEAAKAAVLRDIETARPAAKGQLDAVHIHSWQRDPFSLGGDFMLWAPGQIPQFYDTLWAPHGRIHFCGQHAAPTEFGMEGALESGERTALDVMKLM
ncbi:MAG: FAD-dependent oxidoreductase [Rhodobacteraceae bacterium]|nr:FAD-dependent oxidoreductase [Paracoccaceae bacterium]